MIAHTAGIRHFLCQGSPLHALLRHVLAVRGERARLMRLPLLLIIENLGKLCVVLVAHGFLHAVDVLTHVAFLPAAKQ